MSIQNSVIGKSRVGRLDVFVLAALGFLAGWGAPSVGAEEAVDPASVEASTVPVEPAYVYHGDRLRDPFIPLTGRSGVSVVDMGIKGDTGPFNPTSAELKGILQTRTGRWAILRTADGGTFIVQNGKIHDSKRKVVEGFVAIVKEKSITLMGPNNQTLELKLKKEGDALDK